MGQTSYIAVSSITTSKSMTQPFCLLALLLTGCVVPMPIESVGEQVNLPPYYLADYVTPLNSQIIEFDPEQQTSVLLNTGPIGDPTPMTGSTGAGFSIIDRPHPTSQSSNSARRTAQHLSSSSTEFSRCVRAQQGLHNFFRMTQFTGLKLSLPTGTS